MAAVNIGLDFGTHSTKVVVRQRGTQESEIVNLQAAAPGYPWFGCPSLIRIADGGLWFGADCFHRQDGILFRSVKLDLLPKKRRGIDVWKNKYTSDVGPDLLTACYLAWALQESYRYVSRRFGSANRIFVNVGAPMEHYDDPSLLPRYLRVLNAAWDATFGDSRFSIPSGTPLATAANFFRPRLTENAVVPGKESRRFQVLPETVAPIISLYHDPRMSSGMYLMIDMGAGTTEVSINRVTERGPHHAKPPILCYFDESLRLGGDDFEDPSQNSASLVTSLSKLSRKVWAAGFQKDAPSTAARNKWRQLKVLFTGGGARRTDIQNAIKHEKNLVYPWPFDEVSYDVGWHSPKGLICKEAPKIGGQMSQLAVAHGLSVERQQWNQFWTPFDIDTLPTSNSQELPLEFHGQ